MIHETKARRWGCPGVLLLLCLVLAASSAGVLAEEANASEMPTRIERLRGLAEVWGMVHLFHPALVDSSGKSAWEVTRWKSEKQQGWEAALLDAIPEVEAAETIEAYAMALQRLVSLLDDGRTSILFPNDRGENGWITDAVSPIQLMTCQGRYLIGAVAGEVSAGGASLVGTEVVEVNGVPVAEIMKRWLPIASGETEALKLAWVCDRLLFPSAVSTATLEVVDAAGERRLAVLDWEAAHRFGASSGRFELVGVEEGRFAHLRLVPSSGEEGDGISQVTETIARLREDVAGIGCDGVLLDLRNATERWSSTKAASKLLVEYLLAHFGDKSLDVGEHGQRVYNDWDAWGTDELGGSWHVTEGTAPNGRSRFRDPLPLVVLVDADSYGWASRCLISLQYPRHIYVIGEHGASVADQVDTVDLPGGLGFSTRLSIPWWHRGAVEVPMVGSLLEEDDDSVEDPEVANGLEVLRRWENRKSLPSIPAPEMGRRLRGGAVYYSYPLMRETQILAHAKLWNTIRLLYPYPDLVDGGWNVLFEETVLHVAEADDRAAYCLQLQRMMARLNDGNARVDYHAASRWLPPVAVKEIEGEAVIVGFDRASLQRALPGGLAEGMIVRAVDGRPVPASIAEMMDWVPAATEHARRQMAFSLLLAGEPGSVGRIEVFDPQDRSLKTVWVERTVRHAPAAKPVIDWVSSDVAYVDLTSRISEDFDLLVEDLLRARGVILDLRGRATHIKTYGLGGYVSLSDGIYDIESVIRWAASQDPDAFEWWYKSDSFIEERTFRGVAVYLVDAETRGPVEQAIAPWIDLPHVMVVGEATAGSPWGTRVVDIPGSGLVCFSTVDEPSEMGDSLHGVGIIPDVIVEPTIQGIREGRDEVLEEAIRQIEDLILQNIMAPDGWST